MSLRADASRDNYSGSYANIVTAAQAEGRLVVYSTVHNDPLVKDVLSAFHRRYPFVLVQDSDDDAGRTYRRFLNEVGQDRPSADFIWGSGMDLEEKLINDGYAQAYATPEMPNLPSWAHWRDLGYGITLEPVTIIYNSRFLSPAEMPKSHAGLRDLLRNHPDRFRGRVAMYDPEKTEVGMLFLSQDVRITRDTWNLVDALGAVDAKTYSTSPDMLSRIIAGDQWIGYDVIGSYAIEMRQSHPELNIVYPSDYVLTMSRVGFITVSAKHPNSARLFLDFVLSREGQEIFRSHGMGSVRADIGGPEGEVPLDAIRTHPIRIGPGLLSDLDNLVRAAFLRRWHQFRDAG